ncbi:hypothetical protein Hypma_004296 [Hypsizygus marmoreus]|uniref:CCHC-type domain-containing protein n=1 Tax=Hypsizygus marmoreus TaxID=39966 RepID=A0A369K8N6_HYPMA|nr:hypothetical protein Hypma_004296 [Hypsizygus marmoreus]
MSSNGHNTHEGSETSAHNGQRNSITPFEDELSGAEEEEHHNSHGDFTEFNSDVINGIEAIIERFRASEITKATALIEILLLIRSTDTSSATQNVAFENYIGTIDTISTQSTEAIRRGEHAAAGLRSEPLPSPDLSRHQSAHVTDDAVASFLGSIVSDHSSSSSKRSRDSFSDSSSSSSEEESSESDRNERKGKSVKESKLPWHKRELKARKKSPLSCTKTRKLLKYFGRNPGQVKQFIRLAQSAPLGFPSSEWDNIIKGNAINLDIVLSSLHHIGAPTENLGHVGSTQIKLGTTEPTRKVQTSGDWTSAWNAAIKATIFAFRHRESELRDYADYIEGLFASKVTSSHSHVIAYDKAIRAEVGGGQSCLLSDLHRFARFQTAIMAPDGIESHGSKKASGPIKSDQPQICNRFNSNKGCPNTSAACVYRHICRKCRQPGHSKEHCPVNERRDPRAAA